MKTNLKKAIAILLACIVAWSMLPVAFASEEVSNAEETIVEQAEVLAEEEAGTDAEQAAEEAEEAPVSTEQVQAEATETEQSAPAEEAEPQGSAEKDTREKAIITIDLAKLTAEELEEPEFITTDEEKGYPIIELDKLLEKIGDLLHEGKTKEWQALEEIQMADTPFDGSGHLFTKSFAEDAGISLDDKYKALEAFVADQGKIRLFKEFEEGQILYQDDEAIMLLVLKCDLSSKQEEESAIDEDALIDAGVVITSEAGSFAADTPVKAGTTLYSVAAFIDEGTEQILKEAMQQALGTDGEIHLAAYQVLLADAEGNRPEGNVAIALNTSIELPKNSDESTGHTIARVKDVKVIQVNDDATITLLDAETDQEGNMITSVQFTASAFNYFVVGYTVEYLDLTAETANPEEETVPVEEPEPEEIPTVTMEPLRVEGVTIEVIDGDVPEDTEVVFLQLDSFTAKRLVEKAMAAAGK